MIVLLGIGFLAGVITAVSPCVLPVLPIVLAGGATGSGRRPFAIIAGLVASFTLFTLAASSLLSALGLPQDILRNLAIALLFVLSATLLFPRIGYLLERPLAFMTRRRGGDLGGGFVLGVSLGLVFVPCAGPVLATITALTAQHKIGFDAVLLTLAYALGAAVPMLLIALGGQRVARRMRAQSQNFRRTMGVLLAGAAFAIIFNASQSLQTALGGYTTSIQKHVEDTSLATKHLNTLRGGGSAFAAAEAKAPPRSRLPNLGLAPGFIGIADWLNTPGDRAVSLPSLRGKVVLVDFWTYSCINCIRTLPHLRAWYAAYHKDGLEIVGVHTPEFAFEHVLGNVRQATHDLHVTWPVALDNSYSTWTAYSNQYWPAEYLIDKTGHVRHYQFGEGDYDGTERAIRSLLAETGASVPAHMASVPNTTPTEFITPESYLGTARLARYVGTKIHPNVPWHYTFAPALRADELSYAGNWTVGSERIVASLGARLRLSFRARFVYIVLGGKGTVQALVDGKPDRTVRVNADRLYTVVSGSAARSGLLELRFSPGVNAYAFTFG
jgi:cytochrome c biogenesis protein CcdA/thiol-disulfide isomerase/thioredoxin